MMSRFRIIQIATIVSIQSILLSVSASEPDSIFICEGSVTRDLKKNSVSLARYKQFLTANASHQSGFGPSVLYFKGVDAYLRANESVLLSTIETSNNKDDGNKVSSDIYLIHLNLMMGDLSGEHSYYAKSLSIASEFARENVASNKSFPRIPSSLYPRTSLLEVIQAKIAADNRDWSALNTLVANLGNVAAEMANELKLVSEPFKTIQGQVAETRTDLSLLLYQLALIHESAFTQGWTGQSVGAATLFENAEKYAIPECASQVRALAILGNSQLLLSAELPIDTNPKWLIEVTNRAWEAFGEINSHAVPVHYETAKLRFQKIISLAKTIKSERNWNEPALQWIEVFDK